MKPSARRTHERVHAVRRGDAHDADAACTGLFDSLLTHPFDEGRSGPCGAPAWRERSNVR
ncbi:hypothetical protein EMIT0158MI4_40485 [Burkholderia ambifaria]